MRYILLFLIIGSFPQEILGQHIPEDRVLDIEELPQFLKTTIRDTLDDTSKNISVAELAAFYRVQFSKDFFYDWQNNDKRFANYTSLYDVEAAHHARALDHQSKYESRTKWKLPFNYKNGEAVDVYALRHLGRQHKMVEQ